MRYDFSIYSVYGRTLYCNVYDTYTEDGMAPNKAVRVSYYSEGTYVYSPDPTKPPMYIPGVSNSFTAFTDGMGSFNFSVYQSGTYHITLSLDGSQETFIQTIY